MPKVVEILEKIKNHRHINIFIFIWGFVFGISLASVVWVKPLVAVLIIFVALFIWIGEKIFSGKVEKEIFLISLALFSFGLGIIRYDIKDFHQTNLIFESQVNKEVSIVGLVVSEPENKEKSMRFVVLTPSVNEKILVSTNLYSDIKYGDAVEVKGKLQKPGMIAESDSPQSTGQAGRPFDYGAYLSKDDIYYTLSFAGVEVISRDNGNLIKSALLKIKKSFINQISQILSEPQSSLLAGLVVAGKGALPKSILEEFRLSGVVHIVVLSGYNITIVADFLRKFFSFLSMRVATSASVFGVVLFVLMTGAESTIVRAGIMALIAISGRAFGRGYSASRALLVAGFLMLVHNPKILLFDPSFQLSFLATLGIIYVSPIIERYLIRVPEKLGFRQIISTTISTQLFVLPLLIYSMGNVSTISFISNILILAFIPFTMLAGFIATILAYINITLAIPFTYMAHLLLSWILGVAHFFGRLSWASISIPTFSFIFVFLWYAFYAWVLVFLKKERPGPIVKPF